MNLTPHSTINQIAIFSVNLAFFIYDFIVIFSALEYSCNQTLCYWVIADCIVRFSLFITGIKSSIQSSGKESDEKNSIDINTANLCMHNALLIMFYIALVSWMGIFIWGNIQMVLAFTKDCVPIFTLIGISLTYVLIIGYILLSLIINCYQNRANYQKIPEEIKV